MCTVWVDLNYVKWKYHGNLFMQSWFSTRLHITVLPFESEFFSTLIDSLVYLFNCFQIYFENSPFSQVKEIKSDILEAASTKNKPNPSQHSIKPKQPIPGSSAESNYKMGTKVNVCHPLILPSKPPGEFGHLQNTSRQTHPSTTLQNIFILQPPVIESRPLAQKTGDPRQLSISDYKATPMMTRQLSVSGMSANKITKK